jgi:anti-sigma factor RsiW
VIAVLESRPGFKEMKSRIINDLDIQALVDNELDPATKKEVMAAVQNNHTLRTRYEQLLMQKRLIMSVFGGEEGRSLH